MTTRALDSEWFDKAACKGKPTSIFYPVGSSYSAITAARSNPDHPLWAGARHYCDRCPVGGADGSCLEAALAEPGQDGMRAGLTPDQRRAILIERGRRCTWGAHDLARDMACGDEARRRGVG